MEIYTSSGQTRRIFVTDLKDWVTNNLAIVYVYLKKASVSFHLYTEGQSFRVKIAEDWVPSGGWFRLYKCPPTLAVC